jgi:hypothetical protein
MSAETILYGAILGPMGSRPNGYIRTFEINFDAIEALPLADEEPPLVRPMFAARKPSVDYQAGFFRTQVIHFGASFSHFSGDWAAWLAKFEDLLRKLCWSEARLYLAMEHYGRHEYTWTPTSDQFDRFHLPEPLPVSNWDFTGGPRAFSA